MELRTALNPEEFPRIAKEMGFSFSLRRGRVDWHRIGNINVDQLVQERDLITLQDNLMNIIHYSLDSEYDVKVLDHNFVKLFKLAQLSVDYLMYSQQHLYNCVELIHRQYTTSLKENEKLKKEYKRKDEELKNIKKKWKERDKLKSSDANLCRCAHHAQSRSDDSDYYKCSHCSKAFMNPTFLEAHHTRRHLSLPFVFPRQKQPEVEHLQSEVKHLRKLVEQHEKEERDKENIPENTQVRQTDEKRDEKKEWEEEYKRKMEEWECKYKEEISALKNLFDVQVKNLQSIKEATVETVHPTPSREILEQLELRDHEIQRLSSQASHLEAQDAVWKNKFAALESQSMEAIKELHQHLTVTQQEGKLLLQSKSDYEVQIQELLARVAAQDEHIHAQGEQIHQLSELKTRVWAESLEQELALRRHPPPVHIQEDAVISPVKMSFPVSPQPVTKTVTFNRRRSPTPSDHVPDKVIIEPVSTNRPLPEDAVTSPEKTPVFFIPLNETVPATSSSSQISEDATLSPMPIPAQVPPPATQTQASAPPTSESSRRATVTPIQPEAEPSSVSSTSSSPLSERAVIQKGPGTNQVVRPRYDVPDRAFMDSSSENESEDSDAQSDIAPGKSPPVRSINSLENALAQNPHIMTELKEDLKDILDRRLRELGVDPEWDGIPTSTYAHKMNTLQHHQNITAKLSPPRHTLPDVQLWCATILPGPSLATLMHRAHGEALPLEKRLKSYFHNHQLLLNEVERRLPGSKDVSSHSVPVVPDVPSRTALDRLVSSVRQKAAGVFSGRKLGTTSSSIAERSAADSAVHTTRSVGSFHTKNKKDRRTDVINPKTYRYDKDKTKQSKSAKTQPYVSEFNVGRTSRASGVHKEMSEVRAEIAPGKSNRLLEMKTEIISDPKSSRTISEVHTGSVMDVKSPSKASEVHIDSNTKRHRTTPDGQETRIKLPSKTPFSAFITTNVTKSKDDRVFSKPDLETSKPFGVKMVTSTPKQNMTSILKRGVIESEAESSRTEETTPKETSYSSSSEEDDMKRAPVVSEAPQQRLRDVGGFTEVVLATQSTKSNLKSASSTSSLTKKKVLFAEQESQDKDSFSTRGHSEQSVGQRSSLVSTSSNKTVISANSASGKEVSENESDWSDISNTDATSPQTPPPSDSNRHIQLSTKQSEKIAQISKNIEHQLSLTRLKPTGGVEAMFYKGATTSSNVLSPLQDLSQSKNTNAPVPKPRNQPSSTQHTPVTHLTPSEWDLEDFDD